MGFLIKKPDDVPGSALPATLVGLFVAFGGVLFGFVPAPESILSQDRELTIPPSAQLRHRHNRRHHRHALLAHPILHRLHQPERRSPRHHLKPVRPDRVHPVRWHLLRRPDCCADWRLFWQKTWPGCVDGRVFSGCHSPDGIDCDSYVCGWPLLCGLWCRHDLCLEYVLGLASWSGVPSGLPADVLL